MEENKKKYYLPSYSVPEVSNYLFLPISTIRAWVGRQKGFVPLIKLSETDPPTLSFINLVEVYVLASIRRVYKIPMIRVRVGIKYLIKHFPSEHPLADHRFLTDGLDLFLKKSGAIHNITKGGQIELEFMSEYLKRIEQDPFGMPTKFYPFTRKGKADEPMIVVIDPEISFGRPILKNKGTPVEAVKERYQAGESIKELKSDYGLSQEEIEEALRCKLAA
ncbi:MAG: DUF433 domain-containing protein [Thermodesulfobacteriota bacterium]